jgi:NAD(P)-dependent dehydrogenase (short-subunit alcohol dehydrogenase family)
VERRLLHPDVLEIHNIRLVYNPRVLAPGTRIGARESPRCRIRTFSPYAILVTRPACHTPSPSNLIARIPLGRIAEPEDVWNAILFFVSPASDFITGQTLYLDGGITATQ